MRHLKSGIRRLVLHLKEYSDLARKIISGSMVQDLVDHVQRYIMTVEKSMAVVSLVVQ